MKKKILTVCQADSSLRVLLIPNTHTSTTHRPSYHPHLQRKTLRLEQLDHVPQVTQVLSDRAGAVIMVRLQVRTLVVTPKEV